MAEITKKELSEALGEFYLKNLDPKFAKIDRQFEQIDQRFEKTDQRLDRIDQRLDKTDQRLEQMDRRINGLDQKVDQFKKEMIHEFHIVSEGVISQVKLVAEGVMNLDEKFSREIASFRKESEQAHQETRAMIKFSYAELDRRISTL